MDLATWWYLALFVGFFLVFPSGQRTRAAVLLRAVPSLRELDVEFQPYGFWTEGKYWTLLTAQFAHDGVGHLLNNLLFSLPLLNALAPALQHLFSLSIFSSLVLSAGLPLWMGAFGLLASWACGRLRHGELADYSSTAGFSPGMYGLSFFLAAASSPESPLPPLSIFDFSLPAAYFAAAFCFAHFLSRLFLTSSLSRALSCLRWPAVTLSCSVIMLLALFGAPQISAAQWLLLYMLQSLLWDCFWHLSLPSSLSSADHWCHNGGSLAGLFFALISGQPLHSVVSVFICAALLSFRTLFSLWKERNAIKDT